MPLTNAQLNQYQEDGFVIVPNVLNAKDLAPVIAELEAFIELKAQALHAEGKIKDLHEDAPFETRIAKLFAQCAEITYGIDIMNLRGRAMFNFLHNKNLLDCVQQLIGSEITCSPIQHVRPKVPSSVGDGKYELVPWHQDAGVTTEEADSSNIVTCWIPILGATREMGCMELIPGVQKIGYLEHVNLGGTTINPDLLPKTPPVCAECPKGGVIFMTKLTPHRGLPNVSDLVRWTIDLRYQKTGTPTGRPYNPDFPVRSKETPKSVTHDYEGWCRRWAAALDDTKGKVQHRVKPYEPVRKAEVALSK